MIRIGVVGIPGSGKTTLSRALAAKCSEIEGLKHIELIQEYARQYIAKYGPIKSMFEQHRILERQLELENIASNSKLDILISDSPVFLSLLYCIELPKKDAKEIMAFNDILKKMVNLNYPEARYDIIFHLCPTIKPVEDGIRPELHFDEVWRKNADIMIRSIMQLFKPIEFFVLEQTKLEDRVTFCIEKIKRCLE